MRWRYGLIVIDVTVAELRGLRVAVLEAKGQGIVGREDGTGIRRPHSLELVLGAHSWLLTTLMDSPRSMTLSSGR